VFSEEPFVPWELVHLKEPGQPLGAQTRFLGQHGLVRWLHNMGWPPERLQLRPERCHFAIPQYPHPDDALPEARLEAAFLQSQFHATPVDPQPAPVRRLLAGPGAFDLLHFACHGEAETGNIANARLRLEGRVENRQYVPAFLSATTVEQHAALTGPNGSRPIVVLNACQAGRAGYQLTGIGGFARAFLLRGAGLFVGTLWSVGDSPARSFTESFYLTLKQGSTVADATIAARAAAQQAGDATWLAYAVYGHPHARIV
jgi:CHAT domain-containing protein